MQTMRIVVAMSGGVDSSVAAALLAEQGHDVIGLSMQLYDASDSDGGERSFGSCCSIDDLHDARRVAAAIGIPHYILNFERQFDEQVVSNFVREYAAGPDAAALRALQQRPEVRDAARSRARLRRRRGRHRPLRARRARRRPAGTCSSAASIPSKDQSYFLFSLTQDQLARAVFPVGDRRKDAVREYARRRGLPVADKPDSQEICFIPDHDYAAFVAAHAPDAAARRARSSTRTGRVLGRHGGIHRFTVGQRKGLGSRRSSPTGRAAVRAGAQAGRPAGRRRARRRRSSARR